VSSKFKKYVEELTIDELRELVIKFAPDNFKKEVELRDAPIEMLEKDFKNIEAQISYDLKDDELLYQPIAFQKNISSYMKSLKPFVNRYTDKLFDMLIEMTNSIECHSEEGYLFIDHYSDEECFDFDVLSSEIIDLINRIEDNDKKNEIAVRVVENIGKSYMSIMFSNLELEDKSLLLKEFNEDSSLELFNEVEEFLDFEEKENYLLKNNPYYLVQLYIDNNQKDKALNLLEKLINRKFEIEYIETLKKLRDIEPDELEEYLITVIEGNFYDSYNFISKNIERVKNIEKIEKFWKEKDITLYYKYLESNNRIEEMYALLDDLDRYSYFSSYREEFLKKYKTREEYRDEAITFFKAEIEKNLRTTGDTYYFAIADALTQLKELIDKDELNKMVENLKITYKRRRNFIAILSERFE